MLVIEDNKIGTAVSAFDNPDGINFLIIMNKLVVHLSHTHTTLSTNKILTHDIDM